MIFCSNCGKELNESSRFCMHCGTPVKQENANDQQQSTDPTSDSKPGMTASPAKTLLESANLVSKSGLWGSILIIIGFFTNWVNLGFWGGFTGLKLMTSASKFLQDEGKESNLSVLIIFLLGSMIITAFVCFFYSIGSGISKDTFSVLKYIPLVMFVITFFLALSIANEGDYRSGFNEEVFQMIGIGVYLTLFGTIVLASSE